VEGIKAFFHTEKRIIFKRELSKGINKEKGIFEGNNYGGQILV
jgi:hypothetical protein